MYCPNCGSPNAEGAHFCAKCGKGFAAAAPVKDTAPGVPIGPVASAGGFPPAGGFGAAVAPGTTQAQWQAPPPQQAWTPPPQAEVDPRMRGGATYPAAAFGADGKRYAMGKEPVVALLLSLFLSPVGQFYNGDVKKGLAIIGGYIVGVVLSFVYVGVAVILGLWIWSIIDAYNVASRKTPLW